jgi:hypothetical protein
MIEEIWKIVLDDIVYIPLHYQMIVWAMRENLDIPVHRLYGGYGCQGLNSRHSLSGRSSW